ncbi:DUF1593 domain-containing protein [Isoptericola variabilis]|uniref:DUF1593 domain-containing protein n=1 Tax=Isoptericola variabilis (strain 225) TaxID=743718 RepID=F6FVZ6_ISOV2|nr:protein of unknown function DUF1593 [Isoptericola variabilis 225]TWH26621.1 uncharacterized protein DUF1593 [Isoptericola variabilis J7]
MKFHARFLARRAQSASPPRRKFAAAAVIAGLAVAGAGGVPAAGAEIASAEVRTDAATPTSASAPRTIVTTDPELDDLNSMLRMLLYSNEINIVGLVYSASQHHYSGDPERGIQPKRWPEPGARLHIDEAVDAYAEAYPNLVQHADGYPEPEHLRSLIRTGNIANVGDMSEPTPGSDLIKDVLLDDEPGQVFLQAWGGPNTIARALKSIEEEYKDTPEWETVYDKVVTKTVFTSWGQQDTTFATYIKPTWPDIEHREVATGTWGYGARGVVLPQDQFYLSAEWMERNVSSVGPFGASYRVWGDGKQMAAGFDNEDYFGLSGYTAAELRAMGYLVWTPPQPKGSWISEGDSSNFALLIDNGLRNWEHPSWGGWGGRQIQNPTDPKRWSNRGALDAAPDGSMPRDYSTTRFFSAIQEDFAARLQWTVTENFEDANHAPLLDVRQGVDIDADAGSTVPLAVAVSDPDGDDVELTSWQYREAGTYPSAVAIERRGSGAFTVRVPADAEPGQTIHVILQATDAYNVTEYQRVVITVN